MGRTVVERFLRPDGSVAQCHPLRVVSDEGGTLLGWLPAGTEIVGSGLVDGRRRRDVPLAERFLAPRRQLRDVWRGTSNLRLIPAREWYSIWWFFDETGFRCWYVNLEIPAGRTAEGVDRVDGVLDLVVHPDRSCRWKDEDEAEAAVEAGRLTAAELDRLRGEGERLRVLAEAGAPPFDGGWTGFRPEPGWAPPRLPAHLLAGL